MDAHTSNWVLVAYNATKAAIASASATANDVLDLNALEAFFASRLHSSSVNTIFITTQHLLRDFEDVDEPRVKEWGVDGLFFLLLEDGLDHEAMGRAIRCSPNLTHLYLLDHYYNRNVPASFGEALLQRGTTSLQSVSIFHSSRMISDSFETALMPLLTSNTSSLKSLSLHLLHYSSLSNGIREIIRKVTQNNIALRSISLILHDPLYDIDRATWQGLGSMLLRNTSLISFTLQGARLPGEAVRYLFTSLEKNRHVTSFSLLHCTISGSTDWPNASVLDSLRVNNTLHEVDLTGTPLQNDNAIRAQLLRIKENAQQVREVLKSKLSVLVRPTTVRLFFCGLQYSGKTTLSRSLANWNKNTSWFSRVGSTSRMQRTRGIEVTILEKGTGDKHRRILLWDMAGQLEFHSFHDSMFPDLSSHATPSMFLFVWNPFQIDESGNIPLDPQGQKTRKDVHKFRDEFKYWLRFIASKTLKSEKFKPKVLVAVTRADLIGLEEDKKLWLKSEFTALQEEFQELIQFDKEGSIFFLNAKDHLQVGHLGSHVFNCANTILEQVPHVYQACADARELLYNMVHDNKVPPLITKARFHQLCDEELHMDSQEMREAVAVSLNDSGDLIYFKSLELVVLDTHWFCHKIMGDLLNGIMTKESLDSSKNREVFFPLSAFEALLDGILNPRAAGTSKLTKIRRASRTVKSMKVAVSDLVKLLVGLRLACLEDIAQKNPRIFIPVSLSGKAKRTLFPRNCLISDGEGVPTYLGRRLTCKNFNCTFLTPGLFPLLQVTFHTILTNRELSILVRLEEDVMAFAFGGVKVFIEFCRLEGEDHFIDILVYSSKSLDETIKWLQKNVILRVEDVCTEPRGNQGVVLAHAVIQGACIENFLVDARSRPAVPVKELQDLLRDHLEREGDDGIKDVLYTWQTHPFPASSVVDLLGEVETAKVVQTYLCGLSDAEREISNLFVEEAKPSQPQKPQFGTSQSSREREAIFNEVCESGKNVMRGLEKLGHAVQDLCNAVQGLRKEVLPKLHELFTFIKEGEAGKLPRMFVVTKDDGIVRRVVSAMVSGLQNVRLELLCECHSEPCHRVNGKQGLSLATLDDGLLKRGLPYINALLKVAYVVARVGAHVAVGFGDSIPDFTQVLATIVDAPNWDDTAPAISTDLTDDWNSSSRVDFQGGQQWLFDVLSNHNCVKGDQIYAKFGLRRVRLPDSRAAWVCDKHYREGISWPA